MSIKFVAGVDISLNETGLVVRDNMGQLVLATVIKPERDSDPDWKKIDDNTAKFFRVMDPFMKQGAPHVAFCFEHYALGSRTGKPLTRAELAGVIKYQLRVERCDIIALSPTEIKRRVTGKGTAPKDEIRRSVFKRYGFFTDNDNVADAYACSEVALDYFIRGVRMDVMRQTKAPLIRLRKLVS